MPSKLPIMTVRAPREWIERVKAAAAKRGQSINEYVRAVVDNTLRKGDGKEKTDIP